MALVEEKVVKSYDLTQIRAGDLFYGRHKTWDEGKSGIVTMANERELVVQYYPGIANVTNHFIIPAAEVYAGEWEARWSHDMSEVYEYAPESEGDHGGAEVEPPKEDEEAGEVLGTGLEGGDMPDESGTADLS